jgi:hypothetical protein
MVSLRSYLSVKAGVGECVLRVTGPDHLQTQDANLCLQIFF